MGADFRSELGAARYLALTIFRRDGRPVTTPVWPVALDGRLFVGTTSNTGKVRRLRSNERVRFAACNHSGQRILGEWREGRAHRLPKDAVPPQLPAALLRKYGWQYRAVMVLYWLRGLYPLRTVLELEPDP